MKTTDKDWLLCLFVKYSLTTFVAQRDCKGTYIVFVKRFLIKHILFIEYCFKSLGMESGQITDGNIFSSIGSFSNSTNTFGAHRARLRSSSAFRADPLAINENSSNFIGVELNQEMIVTGISTQGFKGEWVTKFKLMALIKNRDSYIYFRGAYDGMTEKVRTQQTNHLFIYLASPAFLAGMRDAATA